MQYIQNDITYIKIDLVKVILISFYVGCDFVHQCYSKYYIFSLCFAITDSKVTALSFRNV